MSQGSTYRRYVPDGPVALRSTLAALRRGAGDPAFRRQHDGVVWRATNTPQGPALLRLEPRPHNGEILAHAWGAGAQWVLDGVPELCGSRDDPSSFSPLPEHRLLVEAHRTMPGWRVSRTRAVFEALAAAALEQRVTGQEAHAAWRTLLTRFGDVAPGPGGTPGTYAHRMRVPPTPAQWAAIPSWEWLRAGVDISRRRVILAAAQVAGRLEQSLELDPLQGEEIARRLRVVPGVGVWTAAEIRQRAHGDADAFSFADFHVSRNVTWALTGQIGDDVVCAALIEPYRGHRYRVQRLLELAGVARPRVAPRMTLPTHLPG